MPDPVLLFSATGQVSQEVAQSWKLACRCLLRSVHGTDTYEKGKGGKQDWAEGVRMQ